MLKKKDPHRKTSQQYLVKICVKMQMVIKGMWNSSFDSWLVMNDSCNWSTWLTKHYNIQQKPQLRSNELQFFCILLWHRKQTNNESLKNYLPGDFTGFLLFSFPICFRTFYTSKTYIWSKQSMRSLLTEQAVGHSHQEHEF